MRAHIEPMPLNEPAAMAAVEAIFFAASGTQAFAGDDERDAFRERWLGRYLGVDACLALVARAEGGRIVGYLVGTAEDPALSPRFVDLGYFVALADLTPRFPAHLHVNLAADARGRGVGARLVEAFVARVGAAGAPGVHVVTGAVARNRLFYERLGFRPLRELAWNGRGIIMLGRPILPSSGG